MSSTKMFIVGTMRSGKTTLAGILQRLGAVFHKDLMEPDDVKPFGYYESSAVVQFNDRVLAEMGTHWDSFLPLPWNVTWKVEWVKEAADLLVGVDVIKDPRLCLLLPLWIQACHSLTRKPPLVVVPWRPVAVVVRDMVRINAPGSPRVIPPNKALAHIVTWYSSLLNELSIAEQSIGLQWTSVSLDMLKRDWREVFKGMPLVKGQGGLDGLDAEKRYGVDKFMHALKDLDAKKSPYVVVGIDGELLNTAERLSYYVERGQTPPRTALELARGVVLRRMGWDQTMADPQDAGGEEERHFEFRRHQLARANVCASAHFRASLQQEGGL